MTMKLSVLFDGAISTYRMPNPSHITNRTVLVTGGAGFIGSNLCEDLIQKNNRVVCFDNLATGRMQNIDALMHHSDFTFIRADIRNLDACRKAMEGVDLVLHQAALGSVPRSIKDPLSTHEVNVNGFLNVLMAAREGGIKRFVYASSSSVYGDSTALPKVEETTGKPLSPYAVSKSCNELYAKVFHSVYGMETIGLRYFNVFGKHQDSEGAYAAAIPKFIKALIRHESPVINGDGSHSRDFTYIKNVLQMNHLAAVTEQAKAYGEVFNTAAGQRFSLKELLSELQAQLKPFDPTIMQVAFTYGPERVGDIPHSLASIEKSRNLLHYYPEYSFQRGIEECMPWYWEQYAGKT